MAAASLFSSATRPPVLYYYLRQRPPWSDGAHPGRKGARCNRTVCPQRWPAAVASERRARAVLPPEPKRPGLLSLGPAPLPRSPDAPPPRLGADVGCLIQGPIPAGVPKVSGCGIFSPSSSLSSSYPHPPLTLRPTSVAPLPVQAFKLLLLFASAPPPPV